MNAESAFVASEGEERSTNSDEQRDDDKTARNPRTSFFPVW